MENFFNFGFNFETFKFIVETLLAVGTVSIALIAYFQTKRINSKEFEIAENLKDEMIQIIANLLTIDAKSAIAIDQKKIEDYRREIETLEKLQSSPEYLIYLNAIDDVKKRKEIDSIFRNLVTFYIKDSDPDNNRYWIHKLIDKMHNVKKYNSTIISEKNINIIKNVLENTCSKPSIYNDFKYNQWSKDRESFQDFLSYLVNDLQCKDPDVLFTFGIMTNNPILKDMATKKGVSQHITVKDIINKYSKEYNNFINKEIQG